MNKETILALLKSLTNPEVEKQLSAKGSVIDYEHLFKMLAPFLIKILEEKTQFNTRTARDCWGQTSSLHRTAMGTSTVRNPVGEIETYDDLRGAMCIP